MSSAASGDLAWVRHPDGAVKQVRAHKLRHLGAAGWVALSDDETTAHEAALAEARAAERAARRPPPAAPVFLAAPAPEIALPTADSELTRPAPKPRRQPAADTPAPEES